MTRFIQKTTNWKKVALLAVTGFSLAAPAFVAESVQAQPYIQSQNDTAFNGVVTQDLNGDRFEFRADNGQNYIVNVRGQQEISFRRGTRVRVTGRLDGNRITRATVRVLDNDNNNGDYRTLRGIVTSDSNDNRFEIRADGRNYNVTLNNNNSVRVNRGDSVEVYGRLQNNNTFRADRVRVLNNNGNNNRTLRGIVTRESSGNRFEMRGDNTIYSVTLNNGNAPRLRRGDNVEVYGRTQGGSTFRAERVRILEEDGNQNVNFVGRVTSTQSRRRLTVRGDNNVVYEVRSNFDVSDRINSGDRVRVIGRSNNNRVVDASRVDLLDNNGGGNNNEGNRVDFRGVVRSSVSQVFGGRVVTVEADNGRTWTIRPNSNITLRRGDRVRVQGTIRNNIVTSAQIDRI